MNKDGRSYGPMDWHLPSPSSTPTSTTYTRLPFETPQFTNTQSQFNDVFRTPLSRDGPFETPLPHQIDAREAPPGFSSFVGASSFSLNNCLSNLDNSNSMRPPSAQAFPFSDANNNTSTTSAQTSNPPTETSSAAVDLTQIQTPPPTRGSSHHRYTSLDGQKLHDTSTAILSNAPSTPFNAANSTQPTQASTLAFHDLQFSPDMAPLINTQFISTPIGIQTGPSWREFPDSSTANIDHSRGVPEPNFGDNINGNNSGWLAFDVNAGSGSFENCQSHKLNMLSQDNLNQWPESSGNNKSNEQNYSTNSTSLLAADVNPALVYSGTNSSNISPVESTPQPQREEAMGNDVALKSRQRTGPFLRNTSFAAQPQPNIFDAPLDLSTNNSVSFSATSLRRCNTDSAVRKRSSLDPKMSTALSREPVRRPSPMKVNGHGGLGSIPEISRPRSRASVVLTVDEHGNARTETRLAPDRSVDSQNRKRYTDLWDDTESDSDTEMKLVEHAVDHATSSRMKRDLTRRRSINCHSDTLGILTSKSANAGPNLHTRIRQRLKTNIADPSRRGSNPGLNNSSADSPNKADQAALQDNYNSAQAALIHGKENRKRRSEDYDPSKLSGPNSKRWSMPSSSINGIVSSGSFSSLNNLTANLNLVSASASIRSDHAGADTATFTNSIAEDGEDTEDDEESSSSSPSQRCTMCNSSDSRDGYMIRCDRCFRWLHAQCATALERDGGSSWRSGDRRFQTLGGARNGGGGGGAGGGGSQHVCLLCADQGIGVSGARPGAEPTAEGRQRNGRIATAGSSSSFSGFGSIDGVGAGKSFAVGASIRGNGSSSGSFSKARNMNRNQSISFMSPLTHDSFYG